MSDTDDLFAGDSISSLITDLYCKENMQSRYVNYQIDLLDVRETGDILKRLKSLSQSRVCIEDYFNYPKEIGVLLENIACCICAKV